MSKRDTAGHLLLVSGRKWTKTGVACPNSKGMREWHCPETSLAVGWHKMYADTEKTWPEIHCFQCGGHIGTWIEEEGEEE
jgi:hypothetical protein|tara:strand:+ start:2887 stop:3126 length:240 start_codon:yes stop_codon:yes gene_type:complete